MTPTYAITAQQQAVLEGLTCRRVSAIENRTDLLNSFTSEKGALMLATVKQRAGSCDHNRIIAYYLVTDPDDQPVFLFSLRCGALFEIDYAKRIEGLLEETRTLKNALGDAAWGDLDSRAILDRERRRLGEDEYNSRVENIRELLHDKMEVLRDIEVDRHALPGQNVVHSDEIHAAVELVEMCVHDAARDRWSACGMGGRRLGTTMFWHFVVPKMLELSETAGCEFAYLFAAGERTGDLYRYYREKLHFIEPKILGTAKPNYDTNCVLMCKKLFTGRPGQFGTLGRLEIDPDYKGLDRHRETYFARFNDPTFSA